MKDNRGAENDAPLTPGSHEQLWQIVVKLPTDFEPWGQRDRDVVEVFGDCSCSCRWFLPLVAMPLDWGVCANPASPRVGLLTFEHQGCPQFEVDSQEEEANTEFKPPDPNSPNLEPENHRDRGMLVVDETLLGLIPFLEDQRFWVRPLNPGMDKEILSRATAVGSGIGYFSVAEFWSQTVRKCSATQQPSTSSQSSIRRGTLRTPHPWRRK